MLKIEVVDKNKDGKEDKEGKNEKQPAGGEDPEPVVVAETVGRDVESCKLRIADGRGGVAIGGFPRYPERIRSKGEVKATVIMVDFPDAPASVSPEEAFAKISGASALFSELSYGKMQYTLAPTLKWFRMSRPSSTYASFDTYEGHIAYIREAVSLADSLVDFSKTESLVILANPDATGLGDRGPALNVRPGAGVTADGNEIVNVVTSAHDLNHWGSTWLNHEVTHNLGLPDLYAYQQEKASDRFDAHRFVGGFSYMGLISGSSPGLLAWERWVLSWINDDQVHCANPAIDGEINALVNPISTAGGKKMVVVPLTKTKALVVESRRARGIDSKLFKAGALVYTVDSSIQSGLGPVQVYPRDAEKDPMYSKAVRAAGESVIVEGIKVEVRASAENGDAVRITQE